MCGIAGVLISNNPATQPIEQMVASLRHRGPDDMGIKVLCLGRYSIALGNTRLAIVDLSPAGHMPMHDPATNNWITFNGEIYNFRELRRELEIMGHTFMSGSDTEVILKAYAQWGISCVERLRGMFAFGLWDARRRELFLARDRMGEKPLYYFRGKNGLLLFASEIRALLASGLVAPRFDPLTLQIFLYNGFTIAPRTILRDVFSLLPGYWMRISLTGEILEARPYWQIQPFVDNEAQSIEMEDLRQELLQATLIRMIADVPLGVFLSGGLDSSLIVALMSRSAKEIRTFSICFAERKFDESKYARWVAEHFHTTHTEITIGEREFEAWMPSALDAMDQPTYDGINTYFVARAACEGGLKVALSGLGGDELFGGYPYFAVVPKIAQIMNLIHRLPSGARAILSRGGGLYGWRKVLYGLDEKVSAEQALLAAYQISQALFPTSAQALFWEEGFMVDEGFWFGLPTEFIDFLHAVTPDSDVLSLLSRYILRLFQGERTLRDSDSMSMSSSLEIRTVFTDHVLVEKVWQLPGRTRCRGAPHKPFEMWLARPFLGEDYPYRHKQGFLFPFQKWLSHANFQKHMREVLLDQTLLSRLGLRRQATLRLLEDKSLPWSRVWALFVLVHWAQRHQVYL